jgi:hypothetical protein
MNIHPYLISQLNNQRIDSISEDARIAANSSNRQTSFALKLQRLFAQVSKRIQKQPLNPCCAAN